MMPGHLPPNTPQATGSTMSAIKTTVKRELAKETPSSYIVFSNVPPNIIKPSDDSHIPGLSGTRITYSEQAQTLVVKLSSTRHQGAERYFTREIELVTNTMGLKRELKLLGATTVTITDTGVSIQPDSSFRPSNLPAGRDAKWLSVVVLSGDSECLNRLHADAHIWVSRSRDQVKAVVVISIKRDIEEIFFEKFVPDYTPLPLRPQQRVVVTRDLLSSNTHGPSQRDKLLRLLRKLRTCNHLLRYSTIS